MKNLVQFGVITKVCEGYAFARVMDNTGTVTAKEVFLGSRQFVVVDETGPTPWLTDKSDENTVPEKGDYVAFLYNTHPVHRGGATPAYKWGVLSNSDATTLEGGYTDPLMEADEPYPAEDNELDELARGACGRNIGASHANAYSHVRKGRSRHRNPNRRHRQAA